MRLVRLVWSFLGAVWEPETLRPSGNLDTCVNLWRLSEFICNSMGMHLWLSGPLSGPLVLLERSGCPVGPWCPVSTDTAEDESKRSGSEVGTEPKTHRILKKEKKGSVSVCFPSREALRCLRGRLPARLVLDVFREDEQLKIKLFGLPGQKDHQNDRV